MSNSSRGHVSLWALHIKVEKITSVLYFVATTTKLDPRSSMCTREMLSGEAGQVEATPHALTPFLHVTRDT